MNNSMSGFLRFDMIFNAVITIILGILFIINPLGASESTAILLSAFLIVAGLADIIQFIYNHVEKIPGGASLIGGLVKIVLSLFAVSHLEIVIELFSLIVSVFVIICGVSCVESSLNMRRADAPWVLSLVLAIILVICGVLLLFEPFEAAGMTFIMLGIALLYAGVTMIYMAFQIRKVKK